MDNYEFFKKYLESSGIHYGEGTLEYGAKFFRLPERLKNEAVVQVLVIFSAHSVKVLIYDIAKIEGNEKIIACFNLFNNFAAQYSFFKFYLRANGDVTVEGDATLDIVEGKFRPEVLLGFVHTGLDLVQDVYEDIIKIQKA